MPWLSIAWKVLTSRVGIAIICFGLGWFKGYGYRDTTAEVADLQAQVVALRIDMSIARFSEEVVQAQAKDLETSLSSNKAKADALIADLTKRAGRDVCRISPDDSARLRHIR